MSKAMKILSPGALKLWLYLGKNQDKYEFALSRSDTMNFTGMSINTYTSAFNELVKAGYLIKGDSDNYYNFYEIPKDIEKDIIIRINKSSCNNF